MIPKIITLRYSGKCRNCGTELPKGTKAEWHGNGVVYGLDCCDPDQDDREFENDEFSNGEFDNGLHYQEGEPLGLTYFRYDRHGVYTPDGRKLGSTCGCEDYPCCGH